MLSRLERNSNMVESCRLESQAGLAGEVPVVLSLGGWGRSEWWESTFPNIKYFCLDLFGVSRQWGRFNDCLFVSERFKAQKEVLYPSHIASSQKN